MGTRRGMVRKTKSKRPAYTSYTPFKRKSGNSAMNRALKNSRARGRRLSQRLSKDYLRSANPGHVKLTAVATIAAGGALAGASNVYFPSIMGFDSKLIAGAALIATGSFLKNPTTAGVLGCLGSGMLSVATSEITEDFLAPAITGPQAQAVG